MKTTKQNNNTKKATNSQLLYISKLNPTADLNSLKDLSITEASKMIYSLKAAAKNQADVTEAKTTETAQKPEAAPEVKTVIKEVEKIVEKPVIKEVEKVIYKDSSLRSNSATETQLNKLKKSFETEKTFAEILKDKNALFTVNCLDFVKHITAAAEYAASKKTARIVLSCINITGSKDENKITITATDSMSLYTVAIQAAAAKDFNICIRADSLVKALEAFKKTSGLLCLDENGLISLADKKSIINFENVSYPELANITRSCNYSTITNNLSVETLETMLKAAKKTGSKSITFYGGFIEANKAFNYGLDNTEAVIMCCPMRSNSK